MASRAAGAAELRRDEAPRAAVADASCAGAQERAVRAAVGSAAAAELEPLSQRPLPQIEKASAPRSGLSPWARAVLGLCGGLVIALPGAYALALGWSAAGFAALPDEAVLLALWVAAGAAAARRGSLFQSVGRAARLAALAHLALPALHLLLADGARFTGLSLGIDAGLLAYGAGWWALGHWASRAARAAA